MSWYNIKLPDFGMPELIELEPAHMCNLKCMMCHVASEDLTNQKIDIQFLDYLNDFENKLVRVGSSYEPLTHPAIDRILAKFSEKNNQIDICTNGTLLTEKLADKIYDLNFRKIAVSFDGAKKETYEKIRRNANYEKTLKNVSYLKDHIKSKDTEWSVNYTLNRLNLEEIIEAIDLFDSYKFDIIGFILMVIRNESMSQYSLYDNLQYVEEKILKAAEHVIKNNKGITIASSFFTGENIAKYIKNKENIPPPGILWSDSARRKSFSPELNVYLQGRIDGMPVLCKSPFTFARILYDGSVKLCDKYIIGNIISEKKQFKDIWYSNYANYVRKIIMSHPVICYNCDFYKYCIMAGKISYKQKENQNALPCHIDIEPRLIEENYLGFNIIRIINKYYGVKQLIKVDFTKDNISNIKDIIIDYDIIRLKNKIKNFNINPSININNQKDTGIVSPILTGNTIDEVREKISKESEKLQGIPVKVIEELPAYNLVKIKERYLAVSKYFTPADCMTERLGVREIEPVLLIARNHKELKSKVWEIELILFIFRYVKFIKSKINSLKIIINGLFKKAGLYSS